MYVEKYVCNVAPIIIIIMKMKEEEEIWLMYVKICGEESNNNMVM